jgi:hypothetical protein
MAVWTDTWAALHSTGRPATELSTPTAGLVKPRKPLGALRCRLLRWSGASQRRSLKCNSEQMATAAADSASAMAPLRTPSDRAGLGRRFLAALSSGAAPPITVASVNSQPRYCATSQVQSFSCTNAHLTWPELIGSSFTSLA